METKDKLSILREVLRLELGSLQMLRRRAKDNALRAMVIAEREVAAGLNFLKSGGSARFGLAVGNDAEGVNGPKDPEEFATEELEESAGSENGVR